MIDLNRIQLTDSQMFQECDKDWGKGAKTASSEESKEGKTTEKNDEGKVKGKNDFNCREF